MTKEKIDILKRLDSGEYCNTTYPGITPEIQKSINTLLGTGYIEVPRDRYHYKPTPKGYMAIDEFEAEERLSRKSDTKYWITTAIALAAFVKSFFF